MAGMDVGGGKNREVNVEVNIVPFIDLMSVCIIFLLITAVWTQISMIQLGTSIYGKRTNSGQVDPPPRSNLDLKLRIRENGYYVDVGRNTVPFPLIEGEYDDPSLKSYLKTIKEKYPDKKDAVVSVSNSLNFDNMIRGMDSLLVAGFEEVSIETAEVE